MSTISGGGLRQRSGRGRARPVDDQAPRPLSPPPATRGTSPGWRDPRLWIGIVIVAASVVIGVRVLASSDQATTVWSLSTDVAVGDRVEAADLVSTRVHFADDAEQARYFGTDAQLPADLTARGDLSAGDLLPRSAVGAATASHRATISVEAPPGQVPTGLASGDLVDVYLVGDGSSGSGSSKATASAEPALHDARVVDVPGSDDGFAPTSTQQVVLAVDDDAVGAYYARLSTLSDPVVAVVEVGS